MTSGWLEVLLLMKDELNFASTMPGAPSVTMDLILTMRMSSVVNLAILIMVHVVLFNKHVSLSFIDTLQMPPQDFQLTLDKELVQS